MTPSIAALLLSLTTLLSGLTAQLNALQIKPVTQTAQVVSSQKAVLSPSDFVYQGYYDVQPYGNDTTYMRALTSRYVNGQLRLITLTHTGLLVEFSLPSSYGSKGAVNTNTWNLGGSGASWSGDYDGLYWDDANQRLWITSSVDYGGSGTFYPTQISTMTLNSNGTISNPKTISLQNVTSKRVYGGVVPLPSWFQSQFGCGPFAVGFGGYTSLVAQTSAASLGPELICIPDPAGYANGATVPTGSFKVLLDAVGNRGYRTTIPLNYFDGGGDNGVVIQNGPNLLRPTLPPDTVKGYWLSPNSAGVGSMVWGDSYYNTGMWIETPTKQGFVAVASLCKGSCWYGVSTLNYDDRQYELHIWDPNTLGNGLLTHPTTMTELKLPRGQSTCSWQGFGPCNIQGATYDSVTGNVYMVGYPTGPDIYTGRVFVYHVNGAGGATIPPPMPVNTNPFPTVSFSASSYSVTSGSPVTLTWSSTNATSCVASNGWSGTLGTSGSQSVTTTVNSTYAISCTGAGGTTTQTVTVAIASAGSTTTTAPVISGMVGPAGYTFCAYEGNTCAFTGSKSVAFGRNTTFNYQTLSNGTACSNAVFGDPTPGSEKACFIKDVTTTTTTPPPTPVNAVVSAWSAWTDTSSWSTCSAGTQTKTQVQTRTVTSPATNGGTTPVLSQTQTVSQSCTTTVTPVDAVVTAWTGWTATSAWSSCVNGTQTQTQQRTRLVVTPASNGGVTPSLVDTQTASQSCTLPVTTPPTITTSAKFSVGDTVQTTSNLNVRETAGGGLAGTQTLGAKGSVSAGPTNTAGTNWWMVNFTSAPSGWSAEDYLTKASATTPTPTLTPTDAVVSAWSAWTATSAWTTCDGGTQTQTQQRTRTVLTPATNGGATPSLNDTQTVSQSCGTTTPVTPPTVDNTTPATTPTVDTTTVTITQNLRWGMKGPDVVALQNYLIGKGYLSAGNNSGFFGYLTYNAVKAFQRANGIQATGYVGPLTIAAMK